MSEILLPLSGALKFLAGWVAPLGILGFMFVFALRLLRGTQSPETRHAGRAGLIVGLASWVFVVYRFPPMTVVASLAEPKSPWWIFLLIAAPALVLGWGFMLLVERWAHTPAVGVLILVLAATSTTAAYSYVFGSVSRDILLTSSLFLLMGAGSRVIFDPRRSLETFRHRPTQPSGERKSGRESQE